MTALGRAPALARLSAYRADPTARDPPPEEIAAALKLLRGRRSNGAGSRPSTADSTSSRGRQSFAATPPSANHRPAARPQLSWSGACSPYEHSPPLVQHDEAVRCLRDATCRCPACVRGYEALSCKESVLSSDRHALRTPPSPADERPLPRDKAPPASAASAMTDEGPVGGITRARLGEQPRSELRCRLDTHFAAAQTAGPAMARDAPATVAAAAAPPPVHPRHLSDDEETLAWASDEGFDEAVLREPPLRPPVTLGVASGFHHQGVRAAAQRVAAEATRVAEARRVEEAMSLEELRHKIAMATERCKQVSEETSREIGVGPARSEAPPESEALSGAAAARAAVEAAAAAAAAAATAAMQPAPTLPSSSSFIRESAPEMTAAGRYNVTLPPRLAPPSSGWALHRQWAPVQVRDSVGRGDCRCE